MAPTAKKAAKERKVDEKREQVEAMASFGITQEMIAKCLGISPVTLRKRYPVELATGSAKATALVAQNLFRIATGEGREAVTAAIFWLKTRAGWSEYAPPPKMAQPERAKALGKKEQAELDADQPPADKEWADLVPGRRPN